MKTFIPTTKHSKFSQSLSILITIMFLASCSEGKIIKAAEDNGLLFFKQLKDKNDDIKKTYPDIGKLGSLYLTDSVKLVGSEIINDTVHVTINNFYTNGFGKLHNRNILLLFTFDENDKVQLFDSKGLTSYDDDEMYSFAKKTGCFSNSDSTDQRIAKKMKESNDFLISEAVKVLSELQKQVVVTNWSWERGYAGSASGQGIVSNYSNFTLPDLKYTIKYLDRNGNLVTTDDGYVTYDEFESMKAVSFSFYTNYVGNATRAQIDLNFDDELIFKYLGKKEWKGDEWEKWLKDNPKK